MIKKAFLPFSQVKRMDFAESGAIIKLALPILVSQLAVSAIGFVDTVMSGHYSAKALAGVAVGSSIGTPILFALSGLLMAVTPMTAQLFGAASHREIGKVVRHGVLLSLLIAGVIFLALRNTDPLLALMSLEPDVKGIVKRYLEGLSWGIPAVAGYLVLRSFTEGLGRTRPQMVVALIALAFNASANYVLINGRLGFPRLGGAGCGWASGLTFWVMMLAMLIYTLFSRECRKTELFTIDERFDPGLFADILKLGLPISGAMFMECSVFACITLFIGVLGAITVAGHQIALNFSGMVFTIPLSIGMALTVRVGHAIGRNDPAGARRISHTGSLIAVLVALVTVTFTFLCSGFVVSIYTKDPEVARIAVGLLAFGAMYQLSDAFMITAQGALRGYKDANMTCLISFMAYWVITMPMGYLLSLTDSIVPAMGAKGFWISLIAGLTIAGILLSYRLDLVSRRLIRSGRA